MSELTLEQQREVFKQNKFLAMPIAGTFVWAVIGISAPFLSEVLKVWMLYIGTGCIFYLGAGLSYLTGENFFSKKQTHTEFDTLFYVGLVMALLVFSIALPVASIDHTTLPLSVGILAGLMWMPLSWAIQHWVGYFHAIVRSLLIVTVWLLFPDYRFEAVSAVIVMVYLVSIVVLSKRYNSIAKTTTKR
uniref:DUF7010 family protein n=1 Tax=Ningiella ruwaisensis TaxID=2364274 RepID=UPI00109F8127|nr:hypothetical protein [Ningiella ruwaisensis]